MFTLHNGDCLEYMRSLPSGIFDATITDPPYGLNIEYSGYDDTQENLMSLVSEFVPEIKRLSVVSVVFCGNTNTQKYPQADWIGCWFYGTTGVHGNFGFSAWQPFLLYGKNNNNSGMDTIKYSVAEKRIEGHPCSKPIGLMKKVISRFTKEGDTIFDPFMGTGTTGVAALQLGRKFIGCELSSEYFAIAEKRIKQASLQQHLFTPSNTARSGRVDSSGSPELFPA